MKKQKNYIRKNTLTMFNKFHPKIIFIFFLHFICHIWIHYFKKAILKENKISYTKLEENFLKDTNVLELRALCLLYNINVIIVKKKVYQSIIYSDDNILRFIELVDGNYKIIDPIEDLKNNFLEVTNIENPLKSMSAYKLCDLKKMCDILKISYSIEKKADLYSKIELII